MHFQQLRARILRGPNAVLYGASAHVQALFERGVGPDVQVTWQLTVGGIEGRIHRRSFMTTSIHYQKKYVFRLRSARAAIERSRCGIGRAVFQVRTSPPHH